MLVQDVMRREVVTVSPDTTLSEVARRLQQRGIRHLPVVDGGALVGIISDRDVKAAGLWAARLGEDDPSVEPRRAGEIMTPKPITIAPMFPVEEAARIMVTERISALPVTEGGRLVGLVTETDVLLVLVQAMGVTEPSSRIDVLLPDEPTSLGRVVRAVEAAGPELSSIVTLGSPASGLREVVVRLRTINPGPVVKTLEAQGFTVRDSRHG